MEFLKSLFSEEGTISMTRVMSLLSLLIGAGIAVYGLWMGKPAGEIAQLVSVFVLAAFGAKVGQKFMEGK